MLAPLTIGQTFFVSKAAQMLGHGNATVVENPSEGVYVLEYADGTRETLTDSQ